MYAITPIVTNIGTDDLRRVISETNGVALADQCAILESILTADLQLLSFADAQVKFLEAVGDDPNRELVQTQLSHDPDKIVAEPVGLAVLACYALTFGEGTKPASSFLKLLMATNFETLRRDGSDLIRFDGDTMSSAIASFSLSAERYLNVRWRFHEFIQWTRTADALAHPQYVDLEEELRQISGMPFDRFIAAAFVIDCLLDCGEIGRRGHAWIGYADLEKLDKRGVLRSLLDLFTIDLADLKKLVGEKQLVGLREALYLQLLRTPVVRLDGERFLIPSSRFFENVVGLGWMYLLAEARAARGSKESHQLWNFFGALFESYVLSILTRVSIKVGSRIWGELSIAGDKTADAMTLDKGSLALYEVVSSRLGITILGDPGNTEQLGRTLERVLFEKADQLAKNTRLVISDDLSTHGLPSAKVSSIYPVIVQYRSFLRTADLNERLQTRFEERLGASDSRVRPVEVIDAELLESLEEYLEGDLSITKLIDQKLNGKPSWRSATFKNFICDAHPEFKLRLPPSIAEQDRNWMMQLCQEAESWKS